MQSSTKLFRIIVTLRFTDLALFSGTIKTFNLDALSYCFFALASFFLSRHFENTIALNTDEAFFAAGERFSSQHVKTFTILAK